MSQQTQSRKDMAAQLIAKAQADVSFRQALVGNPKSTIQKEMKWDLPESLQVKVVEETANTLYLVLPAAEDELSDEALAQISGGWTDPEPQPVISKPSRR